MGKAVNVVMARNAESFSFYYQKNLDRWASEGKSIAFFDPEKEVPDLTDCDLLYLPGGYPEKHLETLVKMEQTRQCIRGYAERGGKIFA